MRLITVDEYLRTSYRPDCDFVAGAVLERNVGERRHAYAQAQIGAWLINRAPLQALTSLRMRVSATCIRVADIVVCELPLPEEEIFTTPPWLCIEVMSPEYTIAAMQDRIDDYMQFGVPNVWVVDPWKHRGWSVTAKGWATAIDGIMRTADARVELPLASPAAVNCNQSHDVDSRRDSDCGCIVSGIYARAGHAAGRRRRDRREHPHRRRCGGRLRDIERQPVWQVYRYAGCGGPLPHGGRRAGNLHGYG